MRHPPYDTAAPRRTVSVTLNSDLVAATKREGINLSATTERALASALADCVRERAREDLRRDAEAYEAILARHGSFAEMVREDAEAESDAKMPAGG